MIIQNSRILLKRGTTTGDTPTVSPSSDHTDGSWDEFDIYKGEFYTNLVDGKIWTRVDDGILEILTENSPYFKNGGNSFTDHATIGTNDAFDLIFETDSTPRGAIKDTGEWTIGTTTAFVNAYFSVLSTGNDNTTDAVRIRNADAFDLMWLGDEGCLNVKSTMNNTTPVFELFDQFDVSVFKVLANSSIKTLGAFLDASDLPTFAPGVRNFYFTDGTTIAYNCGSGVFKSTDGTDVANMIFRYLATGGTVDLHWGQHYLEGNWALSNGGGSYGGGSGVFYFKNAATDSSSNPSGGAVLQAKSGRMKVYETDGSLSWLVKAASATKTTAAAPYTNDGYVEVVIDGTTFKLMTTA